MSARQVQETVRRCACLCAGQGVRVCVWLPSSGHNLFVVVSHMAPFPAGPRDILKRCQKNSPKAVSFYCWESAGSLPLSPPAPLYFTAGTKQTLCSLLSTHFSWSGGQKGRGLDQGGGVPKH